MTDFLREVGSRIKERRESLKLNQDELAERAGTTQKTISSIENGKQDMSAALLFRISDALKVSPLALEGRSPLVAVPGSRNLLKEILPELAALDEGGLEAVLDLVAALRADSQADDVPDRSQGG